MHIQERRYIDIHDAFKMGMIFILDRLDLGCIHHVNVYILQSQEMNI